MAVRSGGRIRGKQLYDFRLVEASDLTGYENAIADLQSRKYDGICVRGAIPEDVVDQINAAAAKLPQDIKVMNAVLPRQTPRRSVCQLHLPGLLWQRRGQYQHPLRELFPDGLAEIFQSPRDPNRRLRSIELLFHVAGA